MGCGNDKKKAFLTKPTSRVRNRIIEAERAVRIRTNELHNRTIFSARVLSVPRQESASVVIQISPNESVLAKLVRIRVFGLDDVCRFVVFA